VGSEMCIRDSSSTMEQVLQQFGFESA